MTGSPWFCSLPPHEAKMWFIGRAGDIKARLLMLNLAESMPMSESQRILLSAIDYLAAHELRVARGGFQMSVWDDQYYEDEDGGGCYHCGGRGYIVTCIDDLCHGGDECIHGDPPTPCFVCNKNGEKEDRYL